MGTGAAFAALGALLLMAAPGDFSGPFRNPWALTFLLKPNHALGLVLVPLAILAIARAKSWKSRLFAGFILQLVGWAFVIHMVLVVAGLAVFPVVFANDLDPASGPGLVFVSLPLAFDAMPGGTIAADRWSATSSAELIAIAPLYEHTFDDVQSAPGDGVRQGEEPRPRGGRRAGGPHRR